MYLGHACLTASNHMACRTDVPLGCPRCAVTTPIICCELCTPGHFESFAHVDEPKRKAQPSRSHVETDYKADSHQMDLRDALDAFREAKTIAIFGLANLRDLGPSLIMSNDVLERIIDCSRARKISSREELVKETRWHRAAEDGEEILTIVRSHQPQIAPLPSILLISSPLRPRPEVINDVLPPSALLPPKKRNKCKQCKAEGHIGKFSPSCCLYLPSD